MNLGLEPPQIIHSKDVLLIICALLDKAHIPSFALDITPGSFSGFRCHGATRNNIVMERPGGYDLVESTSAGVLGYVYLGPNV